MNVSRAWHGAVALMDGRVLACGGRPAGKSAIAGCELFDLATNSWSETGSMTRARLSPTLIRLLDGRVLAIAGSTDAGTIASCEVFDPQTLAWAPTGSLRTARLSAAAILLRDGRVLIAGGQRENEVLASAELYDPATGSWSAAGSLSVPRAQLEVAMLGDGRVLMAGGLVFDGAGARALTAVDVFDPSIRSWFHAASLRVPRYNHTALPLVDGRVVVAGGWTGTEGTATSEIFDPATGIWGDGPHLPRAGGSSSVAPLGERFLLSGGWSEGVSNSTMILDGKTVAWRSGSGLLRARTQHSTTTLLDGRVLAAGGNDGAGGEPFAECELYDPVGDRWSSSIP